MPVHILSDLHLEFGPFEPPTGICADLTVLAGDIWTRARLGSWTDASAAFGRPVIAVAGNHDYWHTAIDSGLVQMRASAVAQRITLLERDATMVDGIRVLGCTLWTDFRIRAGADQEMRNRDRARCHWVVGDYGSIGISNNPRYETFDPKFTARLHAASVTWLEDMLSEGFEGPTIVVTHHAPSPLCLAAGELANPVSAAYASNLEPLIRRYQPALWVSGHTHVTADFLVGSTRVVSNPRGYGARS